MKKTILSLTIIFIIFSCNNANDLPKENLVSIELPIEYSKSRSISTITDPTATYIIAKGTDLYAYEAYNHPITVTGSTYSLKINLPSGYNYRFTKFEISNNNTLLYSLDEKNPDNSGFSISTEGVITPDPVKIF